MLCLPFILLILYLTNSQTINNCTEYNVDNNQCFIGCGPPSYGISCLNTTINCESDWNCVVHCYNGPARRRNLLSYSYSCSGNGYGCCDSVINCVSNQTCSINCYDGCSNVTINAIEATSLSITGCGSNNGRNHCAFMNIYCPRNGRGGTQDICQIESYLSNVQIEHSNIYTEEGLNDLKISTIKATNTAVFCGETSQYSCILNSDGDACDSGEPTICDNYIIETKFPTNIPTKDPSAATAAPTSETIPPTTMQPTSETTNPSAAPSVDQCKLIEVAEPFVVEDAHCDFCFKIEQQKVCNHVVDVIAGKEKWQTIVQDCFLEYCELQCEFGDVGIKAGVDPKKECSCDILDCNANQSGTNRWGVFVGMVIGFMFVINNIR